MPMVASQATVDSSASKDGSNSLTPSVPSPQPPISEAASRQWWADGSMFRAPVIMEPAITRSASLDQAPSVEWFSYAAPFPPVAVAIIAKDNKPVVRISWTGQTTDRWLLIELNYWNDAINGPVVLSRSAPGFDGVCFGHRIETTSGTLDLPMNPGFSGNYPNISTFCVRAAMVKHAVVEVCRADESTWPGGRRQLPTFGQNAQSAVWRLEDATTSIRLGRDFETAASLPRGLKHRTVSADALPIDAYVLLNGHPEYLGLIPGSRPIEVPKNYTYELQIVSEAPRENWEFVKVTLPAAEKPTSTSPN